MKQFIKIIVQTKAYYKLIIKKLKWLKLYQTLYVHLKNIYVNKLLILDKTISNK